MDQIQNDQPEKCSRCHEFPEDILMLACSHDLCLLCAATIFTAPENSIHRQNNALRCEQCSSLTQLDSSSVFELEKLVPSQQQQMKQTPQHLQATSYSGSSYLGQTPQNLAQGSNYLGQTPPQLGSTPQRSSALGISGNQKNEVLQKYKVQEKKGYDYQPQPVTSSLVQMQSQTRYQDKVPLSSLMGSASKKQKYFCPQHPDEKISYFCYECETSCICPECVIHGAHKNHDVGTVKKAYPIVMRKMEENIDEVNGKIKEVKQFQDRFNQRKMEILEQSRQKKKQISDAFTELRILLDKKEKELIENQTKSEQEFMKFLEQDFNMIAQKLGQYNGDIDAIAQQINQKDQITLLNFYADQNKCAEANAQNDDQFFKKIQGDFEESLNRKTFDSNQALTQLNQMALSIQTNDQGSWNAMKTSSDFGQLNQSSDMKRSTNQSYANKFIPDNKSNQSGQQSFINQNY